MNILVTGGLGYIGSHTTVVLQQSGHKVIIIDNLSNSDESVAEKISRITGIRPSVEIGAIDDRSLLYRVLTEHKVDIVIHLAARKSIGESIHLPLQYFEENVSGTLSLLSVMADVGIHNIIFSSSASVYGAPTYLPIDEKHPTNPQNPYAKTKLIIEDCLRDIHKASTGSESREWSVICLRYFNPIGAHESGLIGERINTPADNIMPNLLAVASGKESFFKVYKSKSKTPDGTGVRDYIHVMDIARAHNFSINSNKLSRSFCVLNLSTGKGTSVLDLIKNLEFASERKIKFQLHPPRDGDIDISYSNANKAYELLGWRARYSLLQMCRDAWRYHESHRR